jgi:Zn-dependent protease with chaperone function
MGEDSPAVRAQRLELIFAIPPAVAVGVIVGVVLGLAVGLLAGVIAGPVALVAVAGGLWWWAGTGGDRRIEQVLTRAGVRAADAKGEARLHNLVEGLSAGAGVNPPRLLVLDSDGLNAMVAGRDPRRATMVVTSALLAELNRIELEAVVASQLWLIRHGETQPATVAAATFGLGRRLAQPTGLDARVDQGAVSLTRYPPALASALEKIEAKGSAVSGQPPWMAHFWLVDPSGPAVSGDAADGRRPLSERVEALREL